MEVGTVEASTEVPGMMDEPASIARNVASDSLTPTCLGGAASGGGLAEPKLAARADERSGENASRPCSHRSWSVTAASPMADKHEGGGASACELVSGSSAR